MRRIETEGAPRPLSNYAQAIAVEPGSRLIFVAGQIGVDASGRIADTPEEQHRLAWRNVLAILAADGMDAANIVDAHVYITDRSHIPLYRQVRDEMLAGHRAAATLIIVSGLADAKLVMEVSVVAAAQA